MRSILNISTSKSNFQSWRHYWLLSSWHPLLNIYTCDTFLNENESLCSKFLFARPMGHGYQFNWKARCDAKGLLSRDYFKWEFSFNESSFKKQTAWVRTWALQSSWARCKWGLHQWYDQKPDEDCLSVGLLFNIILHYIILCTLARNIMW